MPKRSKRYKEALKKVDRQKLYELDEAMQLVKDLNLTRFDSSVDLHVRLGVDPRKPDQALRGTVKLPHGTGKEKKVLVLCTPDKEDEAKEAGADYVGLDEYIEKIQNGWTDVDVIIATPNVMAKVGKLGRILGPRGLMPNPKTGTVTMDVGTAVREVKGGKIAFRVDKYGIVHSPIGRVSFPPEHLAENARELVRTLIKMKPAAAKGTYLRSVATATTMSPGVRINPRSFIA